MRKFEQGSTEKRNAGSDRPVGRDFGVEPQTVMIDGYLVAVTVFSLAIATIMAVITWRVTRISHRESASAADTGPKLAGRAVRSADAVGDPPWPPTRQRPRDAVRDLSRRAVASAAEDQAETPGWTDVVIERVSIQEASTTEAFEATAAPAGVASSSATIGGSVKRALALGAGALIVTAAIGSMLIVGGKRSDSASMSPAAAHVLSPLELVSLDSERHGDHLTIRGLVRNPTSGSRVEHLQAVVFLFDRRGMYLGTTHAAIVHEVLSPGAESSFEVPLAVGLQVSQYRVSFRVSTSPVPHVDRRTVPIPAPTGGSRAVQLLS